MHLCYMNSYGFELTMILLIIGGEFLFCFTGIWKMKENVELVFEICVVIPKREAVLKGDEDFDCSNVFARELKNASLVVDRVIGNSDEFFKVAAPLETLGRAVAELRIMKRTRIGMDLQFDMVEVDAFIKQPDGSLFSWYECFQCYCRLMHGIVNNSKSSRILKFNRREIHWEVGEHLLPKLESEIIIKQIFPLHGFSLAGLEHTSDFLITFRSANLVVLPAFFIAVILRAITFSQFWKWKNAALLARWLITYGNAVDEEYKVVGMKVKRKKVNDALIIISIICLQLPFELAYAHLYKVLNKDIINTRPRACAFPPAFAMSALNNIMEIRTDALKLLAMMKRPVPIQFETIITSVISKIERRHDSIHLQIYVKIESYEKTAYLSKFSGYKL
ncbi:anoctamin-like protein At1g73020 [Arachis hypogaea]|uniref:anoctamin-like protein At1g73020 n=1 Tax=Arachis hypogaea TaxID=3818 RepID=UPI003B21D9C4